jgi:hypothetical protein
MSTQQIPLTYEGILELFRQTDQRTDRKIQDVAERTNAAIERTNAAVERTNAAIERAAEQMKTTQQEIGSLGFRVGEMVEKLLGEGNLVAQFRELGHKVKAHSRRMIFGEKGTADSGEIDLFLEDGDVAILVEAKTTLKLDDVTEHIERMEKYRRFVDADGKRGKRYIGAVAGTVIAEHVINFAHDNGLYVIIQSARAVEIVTPPAGFMAKEW